MVSSTALPTADDPDKPCEKCGAPASWADEWTNNLSYPEYQALALNQYTASPRMWPLGYLINSPYSPLYVERQIPKKQHWRDAFEDLLALDSGGDMIDPESRKREADVARRLWTQSVHHGVSAINQRLKQDEKYMSLLKRMRAAFVRKQDAGMIKLLDEKAIPSQQETSGIAVAHGQSMIAMLRDNETESPPASMYKLRGQWITSLISSGAMCGWESTMYDSSEESLYSINKTESGEKGGNDGLMMTELELRLQYEEGIHAKPDQPPPLWSTASLRYPDAFSLAIEGPTEDSISEPRFDDTSTKSSQAIHPMSPISLMPMSILAQTTTTERTKLRNGQMSVKVVLTNYHTNGTIRKKEIKDDACKILEEVNMVHTSMKDMRAALGKVARTQQYAMQEDAVKAAEDDLD